MDPWNIIAYHVILIHSEYTWKSKKDANVKKAFWIIKELINVKNILMNFHPFMNCKNRQIILKHVNLDGLS